MTDRWQVTIFMTDRWLRLIYLYFTEDKVILLISTLCGCVPKSTIDVDIYPYLPSVWICGYVTICTVVSICVHTRVQGHILLWPQCHDCYPPQDTFITESQKHNWTQSTEQFWFLVQVPPPIYNILRWKPLIPTCWNATAGNCRWQQGLVACVVVFPYTHGEVTTRICSCEVALKCNFH